MRSDEHRVGAQPDIPQVLIFEALLPVRLWLERAAPTLLFAPLLGGAFAAQVTAGSVRLLRADAADAPPCLHELTPPAGRTAARASATDQMVLVLLDDGTPWLLRTDGGADGSATLVEEAAPPTPTPSLVAASVFYDRSGLFAPATAAAERADANMAAAGARLLNHG